MLPTGNDPEHEPDEGTNDGNREHQANAAEKNDDGVHDNLYSRVGMPRALHVIRKSSRVMAPWVKVTQAVITLFR